MNRIDEEDIKKELSEILVRIDMQGLSNVVESDMADSTVLQLSFPEYKEALKELKLSLSKFTEVLDKLTNKLKIDLYEGDY